MNRFTHFLVILPFLIFATPVIGQITGSGTPYWLQFADDERPYISELQVHGPSDGQIGEARRDHPLLFALPVPVTISPDTHGQWVELANGGRVWWLRLRSENARALGVLYQQFYLPPGAQLFAFSPDGKKVLGPYTRRNNPVSGRFKTGFTAGESLILEYYEPAAVRAEGHFEIFRLDYAFNAPETRSPTILNFGFGTADTCNINVNCPVGSDWQDEKRGVCRVQMSLVEGTGWCSGSLLTNSAEDATPYVLTGFHCQDGYTPMYDLWRFDFMYEGADCTNPAQEPAFQSLLGCTERAGYQASDFLLLEADEAVPAAFNAYFNGWNRSDVVPQQSVHIHHPSADIKKISRDSQPGFIHPLPIDWNNGVTTPADHHFRVIFDQGTFEPGSSGGPLFDQNGQVVGQLHGGIPGCTQVTTYHGRLYQSWTGGGAMNSRLSDWLDPLDDGATSWPGMENPANSSAADLSGRIADETGAGITDVMVMLSGAVTDTVMTDTSGVFLFPGLPTGQDYVITPYRNTGVDNGVTTLDMVDIRKHILNLDLLDEPLQLYSADANNSGSVSTLDMVAIQKVILQLEQEFPGNTSWRIFDASVPVSNPPNGGSETIDITNLQADLLDLDFIGTKVGDVNGTANSYN